MTDLEEVWPQCEDDQVKTVFAYFGLAVYSAQCLETQMAHYLVTVLRVKELNRWETDSQLSRRYRSTMGQLAKEILRSQSGKSLVGDRLAEAVRLRNWLAHGYFRDRAAEFVKGNGHRQEMVRELIQARDCFEAIDVDLTEACRLWMMSRGVTEQDVQREVQQLLDQVPETS